MSIRSCLVALALVATLSPAGFAQEENSGPAWSIWAETKEGPGNITVTPEGRVFVSLHPFYETKNRVAELTKDGTLRPFPTAALATFDPKNPLSLDAVLGIRADDTGVVWMLDTGMREKSTPKLLGWHVGEFRVEKVVYFPSSVAPANSFLNDFQIDRGSNFAYIADPAGGDNAALVVVNLNSGHARRVLEGHESVVPGGTDLRIDGKVLTRKGPDGTETPTRVGVNPIALDWYNDYLYFGPMTGDKLYRIKTEALRDEKLPAEELAARVEFYANRPPSDGISIDSSNNIYISDVNNNAIGVIKGSDKSYEIIAQDAQISWPDAFSWGPDRKFYVVANQLHKSAKLNGGKDETKAPFLVLQVKSFEDADGSVGR